MGKTRLMLIVLAMMLILPSFLVHAAPNQHSAETLEAEKIEGELASKDEVVYATLNANGELDEIYVVNTLDVTKAGTITDYGMYSSIKNLTDLSEIKQVDHTVRIDAPEGKFYYQGNMKDRRELPWDMTISYMLNGKEMAPEELVGKDGHVQISILTSANENVDPVFFDHYSLQISLTLDPDIYSNIKTSDGLIANVGKSKQITFTVMPEQEGKLSFEADVVDFELQGIEIAAVPPFMSIDAPDMVDMIGDMESLTNGIEEVNNGVAELKNGVTELNGGVADLRYGSEQYHEGLSNIDETSSELIDASVSIDETLNAMSQSLGNESNEMDLSELQDLPEGLTQIADGLSETADGLSILRENYSVAYGTLDDAMEQIPDYDITEEEIDRLYMSGADRRVLDQLIETYSAAHIAKGTYSTVKEGFDAVDSTLKEMSESIRGMESSLSTMANELSSSLDDMDDTNSLAELQEGLATLSSNYGKFHSGLVSYMEGVSQLSNSYHELHAGIEDLSEGTDELEAGVGDLHNGTAELHESTSDLPDQMQEEIDSMIADYDQSDFEAVSFVSPNNEKISTVQFVIKTERIKKEEPESNEEHAGEEKKGFWTRLLDLFF